MASSQCRLRSEDQSYEKLKVPDAFGQRPEACTRSMVRLRTGDNEYTSLFYKPIMVKI